MFLSSVTKIKQWSLGVRDEATGGLGDLAPKRVISPQTRHSEALWAVSI